MIQVGQSRQAKGVINGLKKAGKTHEDRGFKVDTTHSDNELNIEEVKEEFSEIDFDF